MASSPLVTVAVQEFQGEVLNLVPTPQDTVAVQELRFGDNDTLSAHVAALVRAHWLFLMTDVDYLYTSNPKNDPNARPIYEVTLGGGYRP